MTFQVQDIRSSTLNKRPVATELLFGQTAVNYNDDSPGVFIRTTENKLAKLGPTNVSSSTPTVPEDVSDLCPGEMWLNTTNSVLYVWSGLSWVGVSEVGFPAATTTTLGGVIVGGGLNVSSDGTISATPGAIAAATTSTLGGVIVGSGLLVQADGTISANPQNLSPATTTTLGGVIAGSGLSVAANGTLTADAQDLVPATDQVLGGILVGSGLSITIAGRLSADIQNSGVTSVTAGTGMVTNPSGGITGTGSIGLENTGVATGSYTNCNLTVDAQGRITTINDGTSPVNFQGTTDVTGTAPSANPGDFLLNTVAGSAAASWTGIVGTAVAVNQFVFYSSGPSAAWAVGGAFDATAYVTLTTSQSISGTKTFTSTIEASNINSSGTITAGDINVTGDVTGTFDDGTF